MNENELEAKTRMKNEGYECIMEIYGYTRLNPSMPFMPWAGGQWLFGKPFGNIMIFKVADRINTLDIEKIGSTIIEVLDNNDDFAHIEVNAKYTINQITEVYFNMPY